MSNNCFGRAWLLAKVLQRHYDIEVIGPAFGDGIWKPLANVCNFDIKIVKGYANGYFEIKKMLSMISGDVIYASKPLIQSFGVALIKKFRTGKPIVLDIDDWELGFKKDIYDSMPWFKKTIKFLRFSLNLDSYNYRRLLNKFIRFADVLTVSGEVLHSIYGGTLIWHGRDVNLFDPQIFDRFEFKKKYLSEEDKDAFVISFIGTPRAHKGLEYLIDAVSILKNKSRIPFLLMIVGIEDGDKYCVSLKKRVADLDLRINVKYFPQQPFEMLPTFLSITDLVVIPQRKGTASYGQVPAKIFDAMAMAKPIIASNVSDIPEILNDCGWIIDPENPALLAEKIKYVFDHPREAKEMSWKAREKCKQKYSWEAMEEKLIQIFEQYRRPGNISGGRK